MGRVLFTLHQKDFKMGFVQKLAKRNPRVYKKTIEEKPEIIVKDNVAYKKFVGKKKNIFYYLNPKNW